MKNGSTQFAASKRKTRGVSLFEVMVALSILGLVAFTAYEALQNGFQSFRTLTTRAQSTQGLDLALSLLEKDLKSAYLSHDSSGLAFVGQNNPLEDQGQMHFVRNAGWEHTLSLCKIRYRLKPNAQNGTWDLWRTQQEENISPVQPVLVSENLAQFDVRYFDGATWHTTWGWDEQKQKALSGIRGLPLLVSVRLVRQGEKEGVQAILPVMTSLINKTLYG